MLISSESKPYQNSYLKSNLGVFIIANFTKKSIKKNLLTLSLFNIFWIQDVVNDTIDENFPTPKAFAGNHLPFVGFTYSKDFQLLKQLSGVPPTSQVPPRPPRVRYLVFFSEIFQNFES